MNNPYSNLNPYPYPPSLPHLTFSLPLTLTVTLSPGKQLKHAVLCALAEQIYHHSGGDVMRDGVSTWLGRIRASLSASRRSSTSSRDPGRSASAVQASHVHLGLTSPTVESAAGSGATLAGSAESASAAAFAVSGRSKSRLKLGRR